jgi:hypothetical protein
MHYCKHVFTSEYLGHLITVSEEVAIPGQPARGLRRARPPTTVTQETLHRHGGFYPGTLSRWTTLCGTAGIEYQRCSFFRPLENPVQLRDELAMPTKDKPYPGRLRCRECHVDDLEIDRLVRMGGVIEKRRRKRGY